MGIDLRGGKANARGRIHGVRHVTDQPTNTSIDNCHGLCHRAQPRIWVMKEGQDRHKQ
jgi:hypothetical protein